MNSISTIFFLFHLILTLVERNATQHVKKSILLKKCDKIDCLFYKSCLFQSGLVSVDPLGVVNEGFESEQDPEQMEGGRQQEVEDGARTDVHVEVQVDWTASLPVNVTVPKVNIHSLVMDFTAVSFMDIMAAKSLKLVG